MDAFYVVFIFTSNNSTSINEQALATEKSYFERMIPLYLTLVYIAHFE